MPRPCAVTFQDLDGVRHCVHVEADSVYEACVFALNALKKASFVDLQPGAASTMTVQVLEPSVTHQVTVGQVQRWLSLGSSNPSEEAKRKRLREVLASNKDPAARR